MYAVELVEVCRKIGPTEKCLIFYGPLVCLMFDLSF